jgi:hypothetical protein
MTKNKRDNTHSLKMDKKLEELEKRTPLSTDPQQSLRGGIPSWTQVTQKNALVSSSCV